MTTGLSYRLDPPALLRDLRERAFRDGAPATPGHVGAEVEFLALRDDTGLPVPLREPDPGALLPWLRAYGRSRGWEEGTSGAGAPELRLPAGGTLSFEPGGQLEYSSPPFLSVAALLHDLERVVTPLRREAAGAGIRLVARGIDPLHDAASVPLQLGGERYRRMAAHFDRFGPAGRRMMRQTAAFHVNVDLGAEPLRRWRAANALAPVLVAVFANSARYAGRPTGFRSYRAQQWRELDPSRSGVVSGPDGADAYLAFALRAPCILDGPQDGAAQPLERSLRNGGVDPETWRRHLTTLFPEVRPRGYLELRSADAVEPAWFAAPLVLATGILYDPSALREAERLLPWPEPGDLERAGRLGLGDESTAGRARDAFALALEGARRLGPFIGGEALERATEFYRRFTARGLDPASEPAADGRW